MLCDMLMLPLSIIICQYLAHLDSFFGLNVPLCLSDEALLAAVHPPKDKTTVYLRSRECNVQKWGNHLESQTPSAP
jgi:hypothetical protein